MIIGQNIMIGEKIIKPIYETIFITKMRAEWYSGISINSHRICNI